MTNAEEMARKPLEAWNAHDIDKIVSNYEDDSIHEYVATGMVLHGKDEFRA